MRYCGKIAQAAVSCIAVKKSECGNTAPNTASAQLWNCDKKFLYHVPSINDFQDRAVFGPKMIICNIFNNFLKVSLLHVDQEVNFMPAFVLGS